MGLDRVARRRWLGGICLAAALGLLLAGQTVLRGRLGPIALLLYWFACLVLTLLSIAIALADAREVQRRTLQEHKELFRSTLEQIESEARNRASKKPPQNPD